MPLVDLSKLTKLKNVAFGYLDIQWITMTLRTAESINLQQISIYSPANFGMPMAESAYREWHNLDHLLLQFWTSRSIRLKIRYKQRNGGNLRDCIPRFLPELTSKGVVDVIKIDEFLLY